MIRFPQAKPHRQQQVLHFHGVDQAVGAATIGLQPKPRSKDTLLYYPLEGKPVINTPVIFTIRNWDSLDKTTSTAINTDANGIASYSLDLNAKNYYGNWYVDANATAIGKTDSTGFIYNWWGCNQAAAGIMDPIHRELLLHQGRIHHIHWEEKQSQLMAIMAVLLIQAV